MNLPAPREDTAGADTARFVVLASWFRLMVLLMACCAFVALGVALALSDDGMAQWAGWGNIAFFGTGVGVVLWQLRLGRVRIVMDETGVLDRTLGVGVIPWSEIVDAQLNWVGGHAFVGLVLRDPAPWIARLPRRLRTLVRGNAALGMLPLNLNLGLTRADPLHVLAQVRRRCGAVVEPPAPSAVSSKPPQ